MAQGITQIEKVLYTAKAHTTGGRDGGSSRTSDGRLDVQLSDRQFEIEFLDSGVETFSFTFG